MLVLVADRFDKLRRYTLMCGLLMLLLCVLWVIDDVLILSLIDMSLLSGYSSSGCSNGGSVLLARSPSEFRINNMTKVSMSRQE